MNLKEQITWEHKVIWQPCAFYKILFLRPTNSRAKFFEIEGYRPEEKKNLAQFFF